MKHQAMNPYLPLYEYIPDGEPRIFGARLYLYGSHDKAGASQFCVGNYVVWSAPLDDLGDWRYEGVSYTYAQTGASLDVYKRQWYWLAHFRFKSAICFSTYCFSLLKEMIGPTSRFLI